MSESATAMACNCRGGENCCMRINVGYHPTAVTCPVCQGDGQVWRPTPAYAAMAAAAYGNFGWTGPTHELRACKACEGKGLLWR